MTQKYTTSDSSFIIGGCRVLEQIRLFLFLVFFYLANKKFVFLGALSALSELNVIWDGRTKLFVEVASHLKHVKLVFNI